jgi:hypothetical protein
MTLEEAMQAKSEIWERDFFFSVRKQYSYKGIASINIKQDIAAAFLSWDIIVNMEIH